MKDYQKPTDCSCIPGVKCDVKECIYNDKCCHCTANGIDIEPDPAGSSRETACCTFRKS